MCTQIYRSLFGWCSIVKLNPTTQPYYYVFDVNHNTYGLVMLIRDVQTDLLYLKDFSE